MMTHHTSRRFLSLAAYVLGMALAPLGSGALAQAREGFSAGQDVPAAYRLTSFYEAPRNLRRFRPGDVIKTEPVAAPDGARAWRVMYMSSTWDGRPTPITGLVIAPIGKASTPRPVLAWAHGTTGTARGCAPSLAANPVREFLARGGDNPIDIGIPYLNDFLARGYVVVASDYQGLGAPGRHQFLIGDTTGRGLLDMARAAGRLDETGAGRQVSLLGWSQGGHGALFAGEIGADYAPDLTIQGVATLAPSASLMSPVVDQLFRSNIPHIYLIANGYSAAYDLPMTAFTSRGRDLTKVAAESCVLEVFKQISTSPSPGVDADITTVPGWTQALRRNQAGLRASVAPILVVHGTADSVVAPAGTPLYVARARAAGSQVTVSWIQGGDHRSIMAAGREQILAWLDARRAGVAEPVTSPSPPAEVRIGFLKLANAQLVAKAERLHENAMGVPVRWIGFDTGGQVNAAIAAGEIDFGAVGGPPASIGVTRGLGYRGVVLLNMLEGVEGLVVRSALSVDSPAQLAGKRIATPFGSTSYYMLLTLLKQAGVSASQVTLLDMTPDQASSAWAAGQIDAAYVWEPALHRLVESGGKVIVDNAEMARRGYPMWDISVVTNAFAGRHPDLVASYVRSECAAIDTWRAQPEAAAAIVAKELSQPMADARRMMRGTSLIPCSLQIAPSYLGDGSSPGALSRSIYDMAAFLKDQGRLASVAARSEYEALIDPSYLRNLSRR